MTLKSYLQGNLTGYIDDLKVLAGIDSGSEHKAGVDTVNRWLAQRLTKIGFEVSWDRQPIMGDNLIARKKGRGQGRVLLLGHSDTVFPVGTAAARPLTQEGDKLLGPGTCDMKAGLLAGLYAAAALEASGQNDFAELLFLSVSDEEYDNRPSIPLIRRLCQDVDVVFTLEAARANGDVVVARKGLQWITISARGRAAHAGVEPEKGRNAILGLAELLLKIERLNGWRSGVTLSVGSIEGGTFPNVVPEEASARIDLRGWRAADIEATRSKMLALLEAEGRPGIRFELTVEPDSVAPSMPFTPAVEQLERLAVSIAADIGFDLKGAHTGGASDASFAAAEGVAVLDGLGPIGGLDHGPDEYIELTSIVPRTELLARLICAADSKSVPNL
ncbi:MAG: M20 family metallopeptidase [Chloroflexota bacterium]